MPRGTYFDECRSYWHRQSDICSKRDLSFISWRSSHGFCCDGGLPWPSIWLTWMSVSCLWSCTSGLDWHLVRTRMRSGLLCRICTALTPTASGILPLVLPDSQMVGQEQERWCFLMEFHWSQEGEGFSPALVSWKPGEMVPFRPPCIRDVIGFSTV